MSGKEELIQASKPGPKAKYDSSMCEKLKEVAEQGGHISAMCLAIGIKSEDTFHRWRKQYPEFEEAYQESKLISKAFFEGMALRGMAGLIKGFNFNSLALIMNNKFPEEYKRGANGSGTNPEITINQLQLSSEQINEKIAQKIEKLKSLGVQLLKDDSDKS